VPCGNPGRVLLPREPLAIHEDGSFSHQYAEIDAEILRHLPMAEMRWGSDQVGAWLKGLTAEVQGSLMQGLKVSKWQWGLNIPPDPQWARPGGSVDRAGSVGSVDGDDMEGVAAINSMEHDLWSGHPSIGVFQADFHPKRGQVAVYANQRFASILGLHRQEFLQHIVSQKLQLAIPHIDLAFLVFEDFEKPMASFSETAFRVLPQGKDQYVYVKAQKQRSFDRYGCLCRVTHFWEAVSSAVYRSMRDLSTEAKLGSPIGRAKQARCGSGKQQSAVGTASVTMTVQEMAVSGDDEDEAMVELLDQYARKVVSGMSRPADSIAMAAHYPPQKKSRSFDVPKSRSFDVPRVTMPHPMSKLRTSSTPEMAMHSSSLDMSDLTWGIPEEEAKQGDPDHFQQFQQHLQHQQFRQQMAQQHAHQQHQHQHQATFVPVQQPQQQQQQAAQQHFHHPIQPQPQQQPQQEQQQLGQRTMLPQAHPAHSVAPLQQQQQQQLHHIQQQQQQQQTLLRMQQSMGCRLWPHPEHPQQQQLPSQQQQQHLSMHEDPGVIMHDMWMTQSQIPSKEPQHLAQDGQLEGVPVAALHQALAGLPHGDSNHMVMADVRCING